jgi:acyl dehydratase
MNQMRMTADDIPIGVPLDLGAYSVSREEIVSFAHQWDPMPIHIDDVFARASQFGDLIGSGLHSIAIFQRLCVERLYRDWAVVAGRAIRNVELVSPLRPGATLRGAARVDSVTPDSPTRSLVSVTGSISDGSLTLMTIDVECLVERR